MVLLALPPADHLLIDTDRGQFVPSRQRRMMANTRAERLLKIPAEPSPELRILGTAAAGDGAGDGGQARISRALPVEAVGDDGDGVALAVIVANEHRAGLEAARWRAAVSRPSGKEPQAFSVMTTKGLLLQEISDHTPQEVLAQSC